MQPYNTGPFTDVEPVWGSQLWTLLTQTHIVQKMIAASENNRPAAESIANDILQAFGETVRADRVKQFTGYLIRQVLELNGYNHKSYGNETPNNAVFTKASKYVPN
ncbi:MAG: hypothetical protein ABSC53_00850 [Bacteroidota bacterium]|jgi:hypothetical protein